MRHTRRWLPVVVALGLLGLWLGLDVWSPEARIGRELSNAATALSAREGESAEEHEARVRSTLDVLLAEDVAVTLERSQRLTGKRAAIEAAVQLAKRNRVRFVALEGVNVDERGDRAEVRGDLTASGSQSGDLHRERRAAELVLVRRSGHWRVQAADIGLASRAEPEPRP
jgi:hypothetical protein